MEKVGVSNFNLIEKGTYNYPSKWFIGLASSYVPSDNQFKDFVPTLNEVFKKRKGIYQPYAALKTSLYLADVWHDRTSVNYIKDNESAYDTYVNHRRAFPIVPPNCPTALVYSETNIGNCQTREFVMDDPTLPFTFIINAQRHLQDGFDGQGFNITNTLIRNWNIPEDFIQKSGTRVLTQMDYEFFNMDSSSLHIINSVDYIDDGSIKKRLVLKEGREPNMYEGYVYYDSDRILSSDYS